MDTTSTRDELSDSVDKESEEGTNNVAPALIPLFEAPVEWFEEVYEQFYFSVGGVGQIRSLDADGVTFGCHHQVEAEAGQFEAICKRFRENDFIETATVVEDNQSARDIEKRATWLRVEGRTHYWVYERVPFEGTVTTKAELKTQLGELMNSHPDFDTLLVESAAVAATMDSQSGQ